MTKNWQTYEEVAAYLLNEFSAEFGLSRVEGKQTVDGWRSGTKWEVDAKGFKEGNEGFVIVECRRYTTAKQSQEKAAGLAYRIIDTGAVGGIMVSPLGFQKGARKVAVAANIVEVRLDPSSTPQDFAMQFLNKIMLGLSETIKITDSVTVRLDRKCASCRKMFTPEGDEKICPACTAKPQ